MDCSILRDTNGTNIVAGPYSGTGSGSFFDFRVAEKRATNGFYEVVLTATDSLGRSGTNYADIYPNPSERTT